MLFYSYCTCTLFAKQFSKKLALNLHIRIALHRCLTENDPMLRCTIIAFIHIHKNSIWSRFLKNLSPVYDLKHGKDNGFLVISELKFIGI